MEKQKTWINVQYEIRIINGKICLIPESADDFFNRLKAATEAKKK